MLIFFFIYHHRKASSKNVNNHPREAFLKVSNEYFSINSVWFYILVRIKTRISLSRHRWSIDLQRPSHRYAAGTDYKSFVRSWFMNSIALPPITMEILSEIGRTKIIVRRVDLTKSALIRAAARSFFLIRHSYIRDGEKRKNNRVTHQRVEDSVSSQLHSILRQ